MRRLPRALQALAMTCLFLQLFDNSVGAQPPEAAFYDANRLYSEGKYEEAAQKYQSILQTGVESEPLYFNLGNSFFKLKQKGKARLYYEKALRLDPRDEELQYNLRLLQSQLEDRVVPRQKNIFEEKMIRLLDHYTEREWLYLFTAVYLLVFICAVLWLFWLRHRKRLVILLFILDFVWAGIAVGLVAKGYRNGKANGVVLALKIEARYGPTPQDVVAFTLHEGTSCEILGSSGDWLQIRLFDGKIAWIPEATLERI